MTSICNNKNDLQQKVINIWYKSYKDLFMDLNKYPSHRTSDLTMFFLSMRISKVKLQYFNSVCR